MGSCASTHRDSTDSSSMVRRLSIVGKTKKLLVPSTLKKKGGDGDGQYTIGDFVLKSQSSSSTPVKGFGDDFGSKEETFFDSQAWLESDCEDFYSVNGDFTPSRSNTPSRVSSFPGTPQRIKTPIWNQALLAKPVPYPTEKNDFKPEPSPTEKNNSIPASSPTGSNISELEFSPTTKKKKLSELFRDSRRGCDDSDTQNIESKENIVNAKLEEDKVTKLDHLPSKSSNGTPYLSGTNSRSNSATTTPSRDPKPEKEKLAKAVQRCIPNLIPSCRSSERKKKFIPTPVHNAEGISY